ncbi:MAG TPA: hypothetical protein VFY87_15235 [Geminicoccaceae bacterium]|nr:hypothetical protein [Geminicoccaceae bacterium]
MHFSAANLALAAGAPAAIAGRVAERDQQDQVADGRRGGGMVAFLVILFLLLASGAPAGTARVVNGDTLAVAGNRVRLKGVAAPELHKPAGEAARAFVVGLVEGRTWCATSPASARTATGSAGATATAENWPRR